MQKQSAPSQAPSPESKTTLFFSLLVLVAFTGIGIWMLMRGPNPDSVFIIFRNKAIFYTIAVGITVFFGALSLFGLKRLLVASK